MKTALCTISSNNFLLYGLTCLTSVAKFNDYDLFYLIVDEFGRKKCLSSCIKKKLL